MSALAQRKMSVVEGMARWFEEVRMRSEELVEYFGLDLRRKGTFCEVCIQKQYQPQLRRLCWLRIAAEELAQYIQRYNHADEV